MILKDIGKPTKAIIRPGVTSHGREVPCTFTRTGPFDEQGRCQFSLDWMAGDRKCTQNFFANPDDYVRTK